MRDLRIICTVLLGAWTVFGSPLAAQETVKDKRLQPLRNLNSYFPFKQVSIDEWPQRRDDIRRRILVSQGLWPMPTKADMRPVIHGRVEREDYVVDRVFFESIPGHYVTGSLYRPKKQSGPVPVILCPHGHWSDGRFYDVGDAGIRQELAIGAERFAIGGRHPIQARAVQLARMGCLVFVYDMTGYADSIQIGHRPDDWRHLDRPKDWGFFSAQAELRLQNMMGLQTWNSIRALDFVLELPDVDPTRVGVTGGSGGGTQSMILSAIDDRITASMPCVMVSTSMQGGCTCENAPYLRIDQGNVDIAAATAPRPLGMTAADDWTVELKEKGFPDLKKLYQDLGHKDRLTAAFNVQFTHNYNHVNRTVMYGFFNRHFGLGFQEPVLERDYKPLSREEASVWTQEHPAPSGDHVGDAHEVRILQLATQDSKERIASLIPDSTDETDEFQRIVGGAWETILGRSLADVGEVTYKELGRRTGTEHDAVVGTLEHQGESIIVIKVPAKKTPRGTVVWLAGGDALDDTLNPTVVNLANSGWNVLSLGLFQPGQQRQRMWFQPGGDRGWRVFSGYTYGYNHPLFVRRVHDVLTAIAHATAESETVHLVGLGKQQGTIVAAARTQAGDTVERTFIDTQGFDFATLTRQDHPMFVPGAVKYLGVEGLVALTAKHTLDVVGVAPSIPRRVASAIGSSDRVTMHQDSAALMQAIDELAE
ncbi:MAG: acetylxylan esterase [Planctomycetota bacterium]